jgi:phosphopantothenoylcysteine decarboxylase / phosphopantothenate---cysteine ligase
VANILLGVTGGVAAFKSVLLLRELQRRGHTVRVILTQAATRFVGEATYHALCGEAPYVHGWDLSRTPGGELHIDLAQWADALVVYPATSNFTGRVAAGLADDLLALAFTAFDGPRLVCPAMHHAMAGQAIHQRALAALLDAGVEVLPSEVGILASGEVGAGRLPEPSTAIDAIEALLLPQDLAGRTLLVTAGPTREPVDAVRFLSNPSTGRMGYAVARIAARRGAKVTLISGPVHLETPAGVDRVDVSTAAQMATAVLAAWGATDAVVMAAAVADMTPVAQKGRKLKKAELPDALALQPTEDILAGLGATKAHQILVGFAMETGDLVANGQSKLARKNLDLLVANDLTVEGAGFATTTNVVTLLEPGVDPRPLPRMPKDDVASILLDRLVALLAAR